MIHLVGVAMINVLMGLMMPTNRCLMLVHHQIQIVHLICLSHLLLYQGLIHHLLVSYLGHDMGYRRVQLLVFLELLVMRRQSGLIVLTHHLGEHLRLLQFLVPSEHLLGPTIVLLLKQNGLSAFH